MDTSITYSATYGQEPQPFLLRVIAFYARILPKFCLPKDCHGSQLGSMFTTVHLFEFSQLAFLKKPPAQRL